MAPLHRHHQSFAFHTLPLSNSHQNPIYQPRSPNPDHPFPILAIAVLSIMGTAFLLLGYYIFVNKCCQSNVRQVSLRSWFTIRHGIQEEDSFIALSPTMWHRGLDESLIQGIPTIQYRRGVGEVVRGNYKCVVCLSEFQEDDTLRVLPTCNHSFHLNCIDIWLQGNSNCPLCRTSISEWCTKYPVDCPIVAPSSSPQGSQPYTESLLGGDEDFVVIELGEDDQGVLLQPRSQQERDIPGEVEVHIRSQSPMKMEHKLGKSQPRKRHHVSIMGDECIDVRGKDDQFSIQPIRRSFSDSATDRHVCLSVQAIIQQQSTKFREISITEEGSNRSLRKSFMSFGHDRVSRKAVLPVEFEI